MLALSIGNENRPLWGSDLVSTERLISFAQRLRRGSGLPVTYCEGAWEWPQLAELASELDFIGVHSYPQWNRVPLADAVEHMRRDRRRISAALPGKPLAFTEFGWSTDSDSPQMLTAEASEQSQSAYLREALRWLKDEGIPFSSSRPLTSRGRAELPNMSRRSTGECSARTGPPKSYRGVKRMALSFVGRDGSFRLEHAERISGLYFPLCAEGGLKSCVTPRLGGDCKLAQESFMLHPVSIQELSDCMESRNFWCRLSDGRCRSMTGFDAGQLISARNAP